MEENNPHTASETNQEAQVPNDNKLRSILKTRNLLFALIIVVIILPILFFAIKSTEKKSIPNPPETAKPTISSPPQTAKPTILPFPSEGEYVKNQLIVQYREGKSPADLIDNEERSRLASALTKLGVISQEKLIKDQKSNLQNYYILTFSEGIDIKAVVKELSEIPEIQTVEPNAIFRLFNQ